MMGRGGTGAAPQVIDNASALQVQPAVSLQEVGRIHSNMGQPKISSIQTFATP